jgi:hypothetical protein
MKYTYGNTEVDTTKLTDQEMTIECLRARKWQLEQGYANYRDAKKRLEANKQEKRTIDNRQLAEYEGKRAFEEMF